MKGQIIEELLLVFQLIKDINMEIETIEVKLPNGDLIVIQ